jgi:hypothetical protein
MQKARRHRSEDRLRPLVSVRFQVLLTPLVGGLFIVQSPYWFTIGRPGVFSLARWAAQLHAGFHGSDATLEHLGPPSAPLQGFHLLWLGIQTDSRQSGFPCWCPQPRSEDRFGLFRFRSPLLAESMSLSFPTGTEMFQFPAFASAPYAFRCGYPCGWVSPFRHPRIEACLPAPLGLSQATTSFIASGRQDIHRTLLVA